MCTHDGLNVIVVREGDTFHMFWQNTTIGLYRDQEQVSHSVHLKYFYFERTNIWTVSLIEIIILAVKIRNIIYIMSFIDILYIKILVSTTFHVDKHVVPGWCHRYQLFRLFPQFLHLVLYIQNKFTRFEHQ